MDLFEPRLITKKEVSFTENFVQVIPGPEENFGDVFGGIIKSGQWGWLTKGSRLCITSMRSGQSISKFDFDASNGFDACIITCVSEIQMPYLKDTLIAIGIQYNDGPGGLIVLYSVEESAVICCIDLKHKITCCKFISHETSQYTILQNMNGCLAVGTDGGRVILVDLNLTNDTEMPAAKEDGGISVVPCHIVDSSMSLLHLHRHFQHCQQEGVHFGIQLEVLENAEFIQTLLPIDVILGLAAGLADGRLVLYDLTDMQVFHVAPPQERASPLVKMSAMEPPDDPRPCVYIWAFHENYENSMAVMHSLMYEKRVVTDDGFCYFENFQVSSVRLHLPLNCPKSVPTTCQAISKAPSHGIEETISLCALAWKQEKEHHTEVLLFDINQWYKEEMPYVGDWREDPSYLASFVLPGFSCLDMYFDANTISLFNSIQRPEEHFYPISLSFDAVGLGEGSCLHVNWPGVQNRVVNALRSQGSLALLDPNPIFMEVLNARLLPQFCGLNYKATFSLKAKRETLLSVAIENNCHGLLKECAKNWSDGSHQGTSLSEGLSLSTLTDWLWTRASNIKERCNKLCKVLFNHSGYTLDQREKQELAYISKQLRTLADLMSDIISKYGDQIPSDVLTTLVSQGNSVRMASDYQEILLWLLNIGLLPEASRVIRQREIELNLVPYPYEALHGFYEKRRTELMRYSTRKPRSCYLLFIDSFLEHAFEGNCLRDSWQESGGDGLYPPTSVQAMLRIMLIPDVSFENKCALFLYFFLDLNMAIEDKRYEPIVQNFIKFPSVFKLSASLIKQIQAFWNLDHCHFQAAVDEFISPFNNKDVCPQWQIELFIASLLNQVEANLALRVLEAKSLPISPLLQLNTYLANDLISEAFHFARSEKDEELLNVFFSRCLLMKKFGVIRDLALTESEGKLVQSLLKSTKSRNAEDLNFVYLLQKYKYIEAVTYQDELSKGRDIQRTVEELSKGRNNQTTADIDTPTLVLAAYHTTMTPITKNISDVYLKIKKRIKNKETEQSSPTPLSCQLIKQNASDLLGGIYHSSALGAHFASYYWDQQKIEGNVLQKATNVPFLRSPQISLSFPEYNPRETISYPEPFKPPQKRRLDSSPIDSEKTSQNRENPKKKRKMYDRNDFEMSTSDKLLTHFKNSSVYSQDMSTLAKVVPKKQSRENSSFLDTPYVMNTSTENAMNQIDQKSINSLPGILKVSQPKTSIDETDRVKTINDEAEKKKDSEEEKIIRFVLPVDQSLDQLDEQDLSIEGKDVSKSSKDNSPQPLRPYFGPSSRKSLRSEAGYNSILPMSKNELQNILDKVKNDQSKQESLLKTTNVGDSIWSNSKSLSKEVSPKPSDIEVKPKEIQQETKNLHSKEESKLGPTARKPLSSTISDSSFTSISKNELQDIFVNAKNEQSKHVGSLVKTTKTVQYTSSTTESRHNVFYTESSNIKTKEEKLDCNVQSKQQSESLSSFGLFNARARETESMDCTADKSEEHLQNSKTSQFGRFSNLDSYSSLITKTPKRALSQSSDSQTSDSVQPKGKQLKGRASIHSSPEKISDSKTETVPFELDKKPKAVLQQSKTVYSTETIIDFKPQTSSSKVCTTESKFNKNSTEAVKALETESKERSEQTTVVGELTHLPTIEISQNLTKTMNGTLQSTQKEEMLDTTVGMTLYDTMVFEEHQSVSESSSSTDTFYNYKNPEVELANSEGNDFYFDEKTSDTGKLEEQDSGGSSIILLSSRSSSRTNSRNQGSKSPETKSNDVMQRHISIDDEDDEEEYLEGDENDEEEVEVEDEVEDEDESVEIIDSDDSQDLSNSFSNKIRDVTSTSTSSSLASVLISESSLQPGGVLKETVRDKKNFDESSNSESLPASKRFKTKESGENEDVQGEQEAAEMKDTSQSELKLSVTSESINELEVVDTVTDALSNPTEEPVCIQIDDDPKEIEMAEIEIEKMADGEKSPKDTIKGDVDKHEKVQPIIQSDAENKENDDSVVLSEETEIQTDKDQITVHNSQAESIQSEKSEQVQDKNKENILIDEEGNESPMDETENIPTIDKRQDKSDESDAIKEQNIETTSTHEQKENIQNDDVLIVPFEENKPSKEDQVANIKNEVIETARNSGEEIKIVKVESTASNDEAITNKDSESNEGATTSKVQSKSSSKNLQSESLLEASPRSRKGSNSESKTSLKNKSEVESRINTDATISKVDAADEESQTKLIADVELTPKLRTRRSTSFSKKIISEADNTASPSTRRLSRGGSMPPSSGNQIVTRRRSLMLETLDELSTPDSPSSRTRSKMRSDSIDGIDAENSSVSNVKRSRLSSISSLASNEQPQTPRTRRRSAISVDRDFLNSPKPIQTPRGKSVHNEVDNTPIKTPRRLSVSKKQSTPDIDNTSSTPKNTRVKKREDKSVSKSPQDEPEVLQSDDYTLSRRLTRTQLAAMERNLAMSKQPQPTMSPVVKKRKSSNTTDAESPPDVKISDNESNSSRLSHVSNSTASRRVTRSFALKENITDDVLSIASSTESNKRKRRKGKEQTSPVAILNVIPEEVPSGSEGSVKNSESGKRPTRHKK